MKLYPEVQRKAQEEIDRVVGEERLPTTEDRSNMPYLDVLRWHPIAPMGLPHTCTEDDVFDGYLIPKGTMVISNIL
jgi:cytochrome P450